MALIEKVTAAPSFRVYSPSEMKHAPLRPSHRPSPSRLSATTGEIAEANAATRDVLLKWLGIGMSLGALLFVFLFAVGSTRDDDRVASSTRIAATANPRLHPTHHPIGRVDAPLVATPVEPDFELPSEEPPSAQRSSVKRTKSGRRGIIRNAPY
jgi:hypothetical protein